MDSNQSLCSDQCKARFGLAPGTVITAQFAKQAVHPDDLELTRSAFLHSVATGTEFDFCHRSVWPDQTIHWVRTEGRGQKDAAGKMIHFGGVVIDIDQQKRTEEALQRSERRYSALFANKTNAIAYCRCLYNEMGKPVDYVIIQVKEAYELITGIHKGDIEGKT